VPYGTEQQQLADKTRQGRRYQQPIPQLTNQQTLSINDVRPYPALETKRAPEPWAAAGGLMIRRTDNPPLIQGVWLRIARSRSALTECQGRIAAQAYRPTGYRLTPTTRVGPPQAVQD